MSAAALKSKNGARLLTDDTKRLSRRGIQLEDSVQTSSIAGGRVREFFGRLRKPRSTYCVFNKTRETFISLNVTVADTHFTRLRGLLGKMQMKPDEGIWIIPSYGVHTIGVPFSVDLIYLDAEYRVIEVIESFGSFRISPVRLRCLTVLELANRTIYSSQTQVGDQLLICSPEEMAEFLKNSPSPQIKAASV